MALKVVDIKGVGYYSIGSYRKNLSEKQLTEYLNLFEKYFLKSFTSRLTDYSDPKIEVTHENVINEKYTIVKSRLLGTDQKPEVNIEWRVYTKNPEKPLIRDLIIEGLSLARTQKEEFSSVIETNDGDVTKLFVTLKEKYSISSNLISDSSPSFLALFKIFIWLAHDEQYLIQELTTTNLPSD